MLATSFQLQVASDTEITVRLLDYSNPEGKLSDGEICDTPTDQCDHYFFFCFEADGG